jgi:hypothetical protein
MAKFTINSLYNNTISFSSKRKYPDDNSSKTLEGIIPFVGVNTALFQFSMRGKTQKGKHRINLLFTNLKIYPAISMPENPKDFIKIEEKNIFYYIEKPSVRSSPVVYRCTCKDWYFTWSYSAWKKKAIFGAKAKPYIRKTSPPPKGYPYKNPNEIVGICKHVIHIMVLMQKNNLLKY